MQTIFDPTTLQTCLHRIDSLNARSDARWGKMDVAQMLHHCVKSEEMYHGLQQYDRLLIGRLFGKSALKGILASEAPMKQNQPTHPTFRIKGQHDFRSGQARWKELLAQYATFSTAEFVHPFFGPMTREQIGRYVYKHTDHHLRQFGC